MPASVSLATTDGYCINGNRMRLTGGTYGTAGSTYQTEIADFSNIAAVGTAGNGPASFTVQAKNGLTYYYGYVDTNGNGANSQVLASGSSTAVSWLLSKVVDRSRNNYVVNYKTQTGTAVPDKILWTPSSSDSSSYLYLMQFNYGANVPQSSISKYIAGTAVSNSQLLSDVAISYQGTVVKDYFLGYQASPTTGRNELKSIQECADSAKSNCLLASSVTYQGGSPGVTTSVTTAQSSTGAFLTLVYDFNGDGIPDLTYLGVNTNTIWVAFGATNGTYSAPINTGFASMVAGNLTGGSKDGMLVKNSDGTWWYYTWNGSSFVGTSTHLAIDTTGVQYQLADIDGDGLPDLVGMYLKVNEPLKPNVYNLKYQLNTSSGGVPSFNSTEVSAGGFNTSAQLDTPDTQSTNTRRYDFNGDGRDDLVVVWAAGSPAVVHTLELISTGSGFTTKDVSDVSGGAYQRVFFGNWNDDACTDFVANGTLYISDCAGGVANAISVGNVVASMDWDGDGRADLLVANGTSLSAYLSTGTGLSSAIPISGISYNSNCQYVALNTNGIGLDALGCWSQLGSSPLTYYAHNGVKPDLATSFVDGYGNSAKPAYIAIPESFTPNGDPSVPHPTTYMTVALEAATYPYMDYIGPLHVVSNVVYSDPSSATGGTYTQTYYYASAWKNLQGRGFAGFAEHNYDDSRTGWRVYAGTRQDFPYTGMLTGPWFTDPNGSSVFQRYQTSSVKVLDPTTYNQRYFPYWSDVTDYYREIQPNTLGPITTKDTTYAYDNFGNATTITTTLTDTQATSPYYNQQWTTTQVTTVSADTSANWCLNMPTEVDTTYAAQGVPNIVRHVGYTPDYANCREGQQVVEPSSSLYKVTTAYGFDSFGNLNSQTVTGANMPASPASRLTTMNWGTTGQFVNTMTCTNPDSI